MRIMDGIWLVGLVAVGWLIYCNRASEKVYTAVLPAAALAVLYIVLYVPPAGLRSTFPAAVLFANETKTMLRPEGWRIFADTELDKGRGDLKALVADTTSAAGVVLFHHLLQRELVNFLLMHYGGAWQVEGYEFSVFGDEMRAGGPRKGVVRSGMVLNASELTSLMGGNLFAKTFDPSDRITLPPGMHMSVVPPGGMENMQSRGEIRLRNGLITVTIRTLPGGHGDGVTGELLLLDWPQDFCQVTYVVDVRAEFNRWRSGDPMMREQRAWAEQLVTGLGKEFDEQVLWPKRLRLMSLAREVGERKRRHGDEGGGGGATRGDR